MLGSILFLVAIVHTLMADSIISFGKRFPPNSPKERLLHLLGEVEVILGFWAGVFVLISAARIGFGQALDNVHRLNFTEPCFVAAVMVVAATRPVINTASWLIEKLAHVLPVPFPAAMTFCCVTAGPLLGSLITEPAAMTVTALILRQQIFSRPFSVRLKYSLLGTLFVNISVGGVLTHFAAPPVVMVARTWGWTTPYMMEHFGFKAILAVLLNATLLILLNWREFASTPKLANQSNFQGSTRLPPIWLIAIHLLTLATIVATAHYPAFFAGVLVFFIGSTLVTRDYQSELRLKDALLVGFFLSGLVVLGQEQHWWVAPLLPTLTPSQMFFGSTVMTSFLDNAAITFLAAQVEGLSESLRYAVVAGAVVGGGMTVIANAPNPVGFAMLRDGFENSSISPFRLALAALLPTVIAVLSFWLLPV